MGSYGDDIVNCTYCGIQGQCLVVPYAPHLASLCDVDPHGPLCDRCYAAGRPPRFGYANMLLRASLGAEQIDLIALYAYKSCVTWATWMHHDPYWARLLLGAWLEHENNGMVVCYV